MRETAFWVEPPSTSSETSVFTTRAASTDWNSVDQHVSNAAPQRVSSSRGSNARSSFVYIYVDTGQFGGSASALAKLFIQTEPINRPINRTVYC